MLTSLYLSPNGKDYLLSYREKSLIIHQLDIISGREYEYSFKNPNDAMANFNLWISNQDTRMPKLFCVRIDADDDLIALNKTTKLLAQLHLPLPVDSRDFKKYIIYQEKNYICLDEYDSKRIPEVDVDFLKKLVIKNLNKENSPA